MLSKVGAGPGSSMETTHDYKLRCELCQDTVVFANMAVVSAACTPVLHLVVTAS